MENNPELIKSSQAYTAEYERDKNSETLDKTKRQKKSNRARKLLARFYERRRSAKAAKEIQKAQQSAQRTREQLIVASTDSGLMRRLLRRMKINKKTMEKAKKEAKKANIADKLDGTTF